MQLYHHPLSFNCQKVRIALEEKGVDYWPISVNPIKARNLDPEFFQQNPNGTIPVLINGNSTVTDSLPILQFFHSFLGAFAALQHPMRSSNYKFFRTSSYNIILKVMLVNEDADQEYIDGVNNTLGGDKVNRDLVQEWLVKVDSWDSKPFTLSHYPERLLKFFSRFRRRVVIARMAKYPDLAGKYHAKLNSMHEFEAKRADIEAIAANMEQLVSLLDAAESELANSKFLAGQDFSMADVVFIPVLARIDQLNRGKELIQTRQHLADYWKRMKERSSYKVAIGKYATKIGRLRLIVPAVLNVGTRRMLGRF